MRVLVAGMMGLKTVLAKTLADTDVKEYDALFLPGVDHSKREQVMQNERLIVLLREFNQARKLIAAVCSAPLLLGEAGILKGQRFCSDIQEHNVFRDAIRVQESAVRDRNVITGLGTRIFDFTALVIDALIGGEKAAEYRQWAGI